MMERWAGARLQEATLRNLFSVLLAIRGHSVLSIRHGQMDILKRSFCLQEDMGIISELVTDYEAEI